MALPIVLAIVFVPLATFGIVWFRFVVLPKEKENKRKKDFKMELKNKIEAFKKEGKNWVVKNSMGEVVAVCYDEDKAKDALVEYYVSECLVDVDDRIKDILLDTANRERLITLYVVNDGLDYYKIGDWFCGLDDDDLEANVELINGLELEY